MENLTAKKFADVFGVPEEKLPEVCRKVAASHDYSFSRLDKEKRDATLLEMIKLWDTPVTVSGKSRLPQWEKGWNENLVAFKASGDPKDLLPHYLRRGAQVVRLLGDYALPNDQWFEVNFLEFLRLWAAETYFKAVDQIYEIGCGPAHNLFALAKAYPTKRFHGWDWATPSQEIIKHISEKFGFAMEGRRFDMFAPDENIKMGGNFGVLTIGAMEQLGSDNEKFLDFLLKKSPSICVHFEPIYETYKLDNLFEYVAATYHMKRGYLKGYLPRLRELEKRGEIEILHCHKNFGSLHHDGWTNIVWRPKK